MVATSTRFVVEMWGAERICNEWAWGKKCSINGADPICAPVCPCLVHAGRNSQTCMCSVCGYFSVFLWFSPSSFQPNCFYTSDLFQTLFAVQCWKQLQQSPNNQTWHTAPGPCCQNVNLSHIQKYISMSPFILWTRKRRRNLRKSWPCCLLFSTLPVSQFALWMMAKPISYPQLCMH